MSRELYNKISKLDDNIWKSLFAMSRAYDDVETQGCSFRLLVLSVSYMLSVIAREYKYEKLMNRFCNTITFFNINHCMCDDGFKMACPSTDQLYTFMKKYYNFCMSREGQPLMRYSDFDKIYEIDKLTKSWWGPKLWFVIHELGACYDLSPEYNYFVTYKCFIMCLVHTLPCKVCRMHFLKHTTKPENDINKFSSSKEDLLYWSFGIHNSANKALNKPQFAWEDAKKLYLPN